MDHRQKQRASRCSEVPVNNPRLTASPLPAQRGPRPTPHPITINHIQKLEATARKQEKLQPKPRQVEIEAGDGARRPSAFAHLQMPMRSTTSKNFSTHEETLQPKPRQAQIEGMTAPFTPTPSADDRPPPHWSPTPMRTQPTPVRSAAPRPARLRFSPPKSGHASQFCQKNADIASGEPRHQNQPQHTTLSAFRAHGAPRHGHGTGTRPPTFAAPPRPYRRFLVPRPAARRCAVSAFLARARPPKRRRWPC